MALMFFAAGLLSLFSCNTSETNSSGPLSFEPEDGYLPPYDAVTEETYWKNSRTIYNAIAEMTGLFLPVTACEPTQENGIFYETLRERVFRPYPYADTIVLAGDKSSLGMLAKFTIDTIYHATLEVSAPPDALLPSNLFRGKTVDCVVVETSKDDRGLIFYATEEAILMLGRQSRSTLSANGYFYKEAYSLFDGYLMATGRPLNAYFDILAVTSNLNNAHSFIPISLLLAYSAESPQSGAYQEAVEFDDSLIALQGQYEKHEFGQLSMDLREELLMEAFGDEEK